MSGTHEVLAQDLRAFELMVESVGAYLASDATHWTMTGNNMPKKLTLGGCLMRQERLQQLRRQLTMADQARLDKCTSAFNAILANQVVRFEVRAHDELHARLREWTSYLNVATSKTATTRKYYATVVDTRIVITALINKLSQPPYQLNGRLEREVAQMDIRLKGQWQTGEFVLDTVWEKAYSSPEYWWLYGCPK